MRPFQHRDLVIHSPHDKSELVRLQIELWTKEVPKRAVQNIYGASAKIYTNVGPNNGAGFVSPLMVQAVVTPATPLMVIVDGGPFGGAVALSTRA